MDGATSSPQNRRQSTLWILWSLGGCCTLGSAALVLWFWLPRWAPLWVVAHTPWVEPAVRAQAAGFDTRVMDVYEQRLRAWGFDCLPVLERLLASADPALRHAAAFGVAAMHLTAPLPAGLEAGLCRLAAADVRFEVRSAAVGALDGTRSPRERAALLTACADGAWQVHRRALNGLAKITDREATACKLAALADPASDVRWAALLGLGQFADDSQVEALARVAAQDGDQFLRRLAVQALGRIHTAAGMAELTAIIEREGASPLTETALAALPLGLYGLEAEAPLFAALKRPEPRLRAVGAQLMGAALMKGGIHQSRYGYADLAKQLSDPEPWVRGQVAVALAMALAGAGSQPEVTEPLVAAFVDGRLPAPPIPAQFNRDGRFTISSAEEQFALMAKVTLSAEQRSRLERARKAP